MADPILILSVIMIVGLGAVVVGLGALGWPILRGKGDHDAPSGAGSAPDRQPDR
jgi:hypothetical protein